MIIKNPKDELTIREAAEISVEILSEIGKNIKEGITPLELDKLMGELCKEYGVKPNFPTVDDYKNNLCISVNDVAVHGIPKDVPLKKGDLVSIDTGIIFKNYFTDHCWTWSIGIPTKQNTKLLEAGRAAVENAMAKAVVGNRTGDLGYVMEKTAKDNGFNIIKMYVGHGIGKSMHEYPDIPAFGKPGTGDLLVDGMVVCIECQVVDDTGHIYTDKDGWSVHTEHGGNSVMFEYMVIIRKDRPEILTNTSDWGVVA
ncbi:type I methionyl aminopeptidase [Patescibacteria group bacterium]|nr:type I methionyl aminopeptidase [Patescibacteria group bacterium]